MRRIATGLALAVLLGATAQAQPGAGDGKDAYGGTFFGKHNICLYTYAIKNTRIPDTHTILFYMQGGKIWKNTLRNGCNGLKFYGFVYMPTPPNVICENLQVIRVLHFDTVCALGAFTPYTPPPKEEPAL